MISIVILISEVPLMYSTQGIHKKAFDNMSRLVIRCVVQVNATHCWDVSGSGPDVISSLVGHCWRWKEGVGRLVISGASENRRKFPRIAAAFHVAYCLDGDIIPTTTENISCGGMRIVTARPLSAPRALDFIFTLNGVPIETHGHVVYTSSDKRHAGIAFERTLPMGLENSPEFSWETIGSSEFQSEFS